MNPRTLILGLVIVAFGGLTAVAIGEVGYFGIIEAELVSAATLQVLVDLVIACALAIAWLVADARRRGTNPWPYVAVTLVAGSFGPLLYLLRREWGGGRAAGADPGAA